MPGRSGRWSGHFRAALAREHGASAITWTIVAPIVVMAIFAGFEALLYFHARSMSVAAAHSAVSAARVDGGNTSIAEERALGLLEAAGGRDWIRDLAVTSEVSDGRIRVTVTGHSLSVLPFVPTFEISQTAGGPIERWTRP